MSNVVEINTDKKSCLSFFEKIKNNKKLQTILIVVALVLALIIFIANSIIPKNEEVESDNSVIDYVSNLEEKLENTLSQVNGVGKVKVVITIESGMETVLASKVTITEKENYVEREETPITVNGKTIVVKELYPKIIGVLIVAEGVESISVLSKIQQATISLLDIKLNQIEILSM